MNTFTPVLRLATFIGVLSLLGGCSNLQTTSEPNRQRVLSDTMLDGSIRVDTENARVAELWLAAEQARKSNDDQKALDYLIQGLELSPDNSLLWSRAAEIQLSNEQAVLAENYAIKSNLYAGQDSSMLLRNWMIIEHSRNMRGDLLGVRSAHKKVQQYQYQ